MKDLKFTNSVKNEFIKIKNTINGNNEIDIDGEIGQSWFTDGYTFEKFKQDLSHLDGKIVININSYGGNLFEALAIYDHIRSLKNKVVTKIVGTSASAATIISLGGDKRYITKNSRYLIHKPMIAIQGNSDDFEKALEQLKDLDKQIIDLYVERTRLNYDEVLKLMREEKFISAEDAIKFGFCDDYVGDKNFENNSTINTEDMTKEIYDMLQVSNDAEAKEKIQSMLNVIAQTNNIAEPTNEVKATETKLENNTTKKNTVTDILATEESASEEVLVKDVVTPINEVDEDEEKVDDDDDVVNEEEEKEDDEIKNEEEEEVDEDEVEKLKAEISRLQQQLNEKEEKEEEETKNKIQNFVQELINSKKIKEDAFDKWIEITTEKGIENTTNLINSISVENQPKISSMIETRELDQKEIYNMWKSGKISGEEYLKLKK